MPAPLHGDGPFQYFLDPEFQNSPSPQRITPAKPGKPRAPIATAHQRSLLIERVVRPRYSKPASFASFQTVKDLVDFMFTNFSRPMGLGIANEIRPGHAEEHSKIWQSLEEQLPIQLNLRWPKIGTHYSAIRNARDKDTLRICLSLEVANRPLIGKSTGEFFLSSHDLAERLHIGKTSAMRSLQRLQFSGFLELIRNGSKAHSPTGKNLASVYRIHSDYCSN